MRKTDHEVHEVHEVQSEIYHRTSWVAAHLEDEQNRVPFTAVLSRRRREKKWHLQLFFDYPIPHRWKGLARRLAKRKLAQMLLDQGWEIDQVVGWAEHQGHYGKKEIITDLEQSGS